jgi:putative addiction module component (TIGR02574 family)
VTHQKAWKDEIARRIKELDSGKAKTVPWDEVQRRIAAKLQTRPVNQPKKQSS